MLRLKQALKECGIQQQELVKVSRFGKSQISQTLNTGILPANSAQFATDVETFVHGQPRITEWLNAGGMRFKALFDVLPESGTHKTMYSPHENVGPADLEASITTLVGLCCLGEVTIEDLSRLARVANYLHMNLVERCSPKEYSDIQTLAVAILEGGLAPCPA